MTLPAALRMHPLQWGAVTYLIVTLACTRIPLVNYLGYEFSFVTAIAATVIAGWSTIRIIGLVYRGQESTPGTTMAAFRRSLAGNLLLLLIPLLLMTAEAAIIKNCSLLLGLEFFVAIPVVTVVFSCTLALFCVVHYRLPKTAFAAFVLATLGYALGLGYWTPAIFSYNVFYGYFPGITYDEILELRWPLVLFRALSVMAAAVLLWLGHILLTVSIPADSVVVKGVALARALVTGKRGIASGIIAVVIVAVYVFRCELGFESTSAFVRKSLGSSYSTDHVTLYYDSTSFSPQEVHRIASVHEFRLSQTWDAFVLPHHGRVESYIYPSAEAKQRLIGAGLTSISKPWRMEIHCTKQSLDAVLKHELTHVVAGVFGLPVIRASLSPGLTEGLATALEGGWGSRTLYQYAAAIQRSGLMPDMRGMMKMTGFAQQSSSVSYILAGSFCRYLIDRFGIRKLTQVYRGDEYRAVYGRSLEELLREWDRFLLRVPGDPGDEEVVDAVFRRPPIFGKVCARVVASENKHAATLFEAREYLAATALYTASYHETGSYEALAGWMASALRSHRYGDVITAYDTIMAPSARPGEYLGLYLLIGDAYWAEDSVVPALRLYNQLERDRLSPGLTESAAIRALAIDDEGIAPGLRQFFLSSDPDSLRVTALDSMVLRAPDDPVLRYLRGRTLYGLQRFGESLREFKRCSFQTVDAQLETSRLRWIGETLFRLGRYQEAKAAFWTSLNPVFSEAAKSAVDDRIEECDWMSGHE